MQMHVGVQRRAKAVHKQHPAAAACRRRACARSRCRAALRASRSPPPASSSLHHGRKSSAGASEIPPPTSELPLLEIPAPPGAPPPPPCAVCCSPGTSRVPCTNTLPKSPNRTSHTAPAQSRAPECRTINFCVSSTPNVHTHEITSLLYLKIFFDNTDVIKFQRLLNKVFRFGVTRQ